MRCPQLPFITNGVVSLGVQEGRMCELRRFTMARALR